MTNGLPLCTVLLFLFLCFTPQLAEGAKSKLTPLPMVSPPIARRSRSLAPIPFKGTFTGKTRAAGMMYSYFTGKFRGVQLHKFIQAKFSMGSHGRLNMLGFVGKFTSTFQGNYMSVLGRQSITGTNMATFDGVFSGTRIKIKMKARQKISVRKSGYIKAHEKGSFTTTSGDMVGGTYSFWLDGDKVYMKIRTKPKNIKGKKRKKGKKGSYIEMKIIVPHLAMLLAGDMHGHWSMYYGGKMLSGSLKEMMAMA